MLTNLTQMGCGECDEHTFKVYELPGNTHGLDALTGLVIECKKCKKYTVIKPYYPLLRIDYNEGDSSLCKV